MPHVNTPNLQEIRNTLCAKLQPENLTEFNLIFYFKIKKVSLFTTSACIPVRGTYAEPGGPVPSGVLSQVWSEID